MGRVWSSRASSNRARARVRELGLPTQPSLAAAELEARYRSIRATKLVACASACLATSGRLWPWTALLRMSRSRNN